MPLATGFADGRQRLRVGKAQAHQHSAAGTGASALGCGDNGCAALVAGMGSLFELKCILPSLLTTSRVEIARLCISGTASRAGPGPQQQCAYGLARGRMTAFRD